MNDIAIRYRAEILRAVLGPRASELKAHDLTRLNQIAEHLAHCEEAQGALRAKGYGLSGMTFMQVVREVPNYSPGILKQIFKTPGCGSNGLRYSTEDIARYMGAPI